MERSHCFFSFDGMDGTGKSTQLRLFQQWLIEQGRDVIPCRDPGSTALGEALRELLLRDQVGEIHMRSEMLMYMAARAQLVEEVIRPALEAGKTVVSDRFLLANVVYQAHAGGLDVPETWTVGRIATGNLQPDRIFLLDMTVDAAAKRLHGVTDRLERRGRTYFQRVRDGFLAAAANSPNQIAVIEADRPIEEVQSAVRDVAMKGCLNP